MRDNKPHIYGFCPAGCRWETIHKQDYEKSAALFPIYEDVNGKVFIDEKKKYKIFIDTIVQSIETMSAETIARLYSSCAAIGTDIYIFGGYIEANQQSISSIQKYDTITDNVSTMTTYISTKHPYCAVVGDYIYVFGVSATTNDIAGIVKYDPQTDTKTTMSVTTSSNVCGCAAIGTDIYFFENNTIKKYDTTTDTISSLSGTYTSNKTYFPSVVIGTDIYFFASNNAIQKYDTITDNVSTMSVAATPDCCAAIGTDIYLFDNNTIQKYDTSENTISTMAAKPIDRYGTTCTNIGNYIYIFGGGTGIDTEDAICSIEKFNDLNYGGSVILSYVSNGLEKYYQFDIADYYDAYKNYLYFELLSVSVNAAGTELTLVYEINGNRNTAIILGNSIDITDYSIKVESAASVFFCNSDASFTLYAENGLEALCLIGVQTGNGEPGATTIPTLWFNRNPLVGEKFNYYHLNQLTNILYVVDAEILSNDGQEVNTIYYGSYRISGSITSGSAQQTLTAAGWDSTTNTQTISLTIDTAKRNEIDVDPASVEEWASCGVVATSESSTGITFKCNTVPTNDLIFRVISSEVNYVS